MKPSDYVKLVKDIFSVEPGSVLLKELESELDRNLFDKDPYIHAFNSGQLELVRRIRLITQSSNSNIKLLRQHEKEELDSDY